MYAVIVTGGKQYKIEEGASLQVEKLSAPIGSQVEFTEILLVANGEQVVIGEPNLASVKVLAEVIQQGRAKKIEIIKFRRRKHYMRRQGHRQYYTTVKIKQILWQEVACTNNS